MLTKLRIILVIFIILGVLSSSLTAQESVEKLANEFGEKFVSMLSAKDTNQLIQLLPTSEEIEWLVENKLSEEGKAYYLKNYKNGQAVVDLLKDNMFYVFEDNNKYMEDFWPLISLKKIKFERVEIQQVSDNYESSYTTHFIDIIFSQSFQDFGKLKFNLRVNVSLVKNRFSLVFYEVDVLDTDNFYELTSPKSEEVGEAIVKALFSHDTKGIKEYLNPSQDDIEWEVKQRFADAGFDACIDYPEDCYLTKESLDKLVNISIPESFAELKEYFSSIIEKEPIKDYKITGYSDIPAESDIAFTNLLEVKVTVNYTNSTSVEYGIILGIMLGKEKYYLSAIEHEIENYTQMREYELLAEKAKAEELAAKGKTLENEFYDNIGRKMNPEDCQGIESVKLAKIELLNEERNYLEVIEKSDQYIKCVSKARIKDVVKVYFLRGIAFGALYKTEIETKPKTYPIKMKIIPEYLIKAIESFEEAFELIEYANWWNCRLYTSEKERFLFHTLAETDEYAQELTNQGKLTEAIPYYEAICIGGKRIESPNFELKRTLAKAGYYVGATAVNNQEDSKALEYLPLAFPIEEAYLQLSKEKLSSKFLTNEETSANMYYNLGIILYNTAFDMYDFNITAEQTEVLQSIKTKLVNAKTCVKLGKILDPTYSQADLMLDKIDMLLESVNKVLE